MMKRMTYGAAALATGLLLIAAPVHAQGRPLVAPLSGGVDANLGDVDGSGAVRLDLNQGQSRICFHVEVEGLSPVSELRIVNLVTQQTVVVLQDGLSEESGCINVDKELVKEIRQNYSRYAVSVDTSQYPEGAIRGTLLLPSAAVGPNGLKIAHPNAGAGSSADSPGHNKVGESLEDHDQGFGNDDKNDMDEQEQADEDVQDDEADDDDDDDKDKHGQKDKNDDKDNGNNQGESGENGRGGGK